MITSAPIFSSTTIRSWGILGMSKMERTSECQLGDDTYEINVVL